MNGLPGIGPVPEQEEPNGQDAPPKDKGRFLNFNLSEIKWLNVGKGIGIVLLASLGAGYGNHLLGDKEYISDPALAAEIVKVEGEANMCRAVTDTIDKRLTKLEGVVTDVMKLQVDTGVLTEKARNLEINVNDVKTALKDVTTKQEKLQEGIDKILRKLK